MRNPITGLSVSALLILLSASAHGVLFPTFPLRLTETEQIQLTRLACTDPYGVNARRIEAHTYDRTDTSSASAVIECEPHGQFKSKAMHYVVDCGRKGGRWSCSEGQLEILVPVGSRDIVVRPGTFAPEFAYETVRKIGLAGSFEGRSLQEALESPCYMDAGMAEELIDIHCEGAGVVITISRWCPQSDCPRILSLSWVMY